MLLFPDAPARVRLLALPPDAAPPTTALSDAERARLAAFRYPGRRRQFALGRAALRELAAEALACGPAGVEVRVAPDGAPEVAGLHVALGHTTGGDGTALAVAAVGERPLGVDVEAVRPRHPELWRRILAPGEYPLVEALGADRDAAQVTLWALKEAVLKAERTGLRQATQAVRLTLDAQARVGWAETPGGRWRLAWETAHGCVVALATEAGTGKAR